MKATLTISLAAALVVGTPIGAAAQTAAPAAAPVTVTMQAENGSGENGTATLAQQGADVLVTISLSNGGTTPQPAHVHTGSCAKLGGVQYPLTNVVDGKSTTTIKGVTLASLQTGGFAINVHKSASDLATYTSCGDIPKAP